jgi:hypothetical protein
MVFNDRAFPFTFTLPCNPTLIDPLTFGDEVEEVVFEDVAFVDNVDFALAFGIEGLLLIILLLERLEVFERVGITGVVLEDDNCNDDVEVFDNDVGLRRGEALVEDTFGIVGDDDDNKEITFTLNLTPAKMEDLTGSGIILGKSGWARSGGIK